MIINFIGYNKSCDKKIAKINSYNNNFMLFDNFTIVSINITQYRYYILLLNQ